MEALKKFEERKSEMGYLEDIIIHNNEQVKSDKSNRSEAVKKLNTAIRAAIVLSCSHIEGYIEDLVMELVDELCKKNVSAEKISGYLKATYLEKEFRSICDSYRNQDESLAEKVRSFFLKYNKLWANQPLIRGDIEGKYIIENFSNPHTKRIENLFNKMGIKEIFSGIDREIIKDIDYIVDRRHHIAHGSNINESETPDDMKKYFTSISKFVEAIDNKIVNYLKTEYNIECQ